MNGTEVSSLSDGQRRDFRITRIGLVFQEFQSYEDAPGGKPRQENSTLASSEREGEA